MVHSTCATPAAVFSSNYSCASSSSRASSTFERSFYDCTSASTSMSSLESCSSTAKRCSCELTNESELNRLYIDHAQSTDGLWHGPLPLHEWKKRFLPSREIESYEIDFSAVPGLHDAINLENRVAHSGLCATVFPRATLGVHGQDHTTNTLFSADFSILSEDLEMDHDSRYVRDELLSRTMAFGDIVPEKCDPCPFANGKPDTEEAAYTRGRLAAMARAVAVNSHRTFCYAFILMPELARLMRFDHAGIVFSELFPWRTSGDLINFLVSFDCMSLAQRGCDTSVSRIASDSEEGVQAKEILACSDALPDDVQHSTVIPADYHGALSLMNVYDDDQKIYHRVVVHRPVKAVEHYVGRATRGFYGVDLDESAVVYVKDAWRIASPNAAPEAATYRRLNEHGVPYLPGFYLGGDVPEDTASLRAQSSVTSLATAVQSTRSQLLLENRDELLKRPRDAIIGLHAHVHHRLLFKKIGRPLKSFKSTLQLCMALTHGLKAHGAAYEDAMILHRDISGGNVLIDKHGQGMLIDWDMCLWRENKEEAERTGQKIGTWAYISADLLIGRSKRPHLLRDDLESFLHVLYYHVFRYRPTVPASSAAQKELFASMDRVFNTAWSTDDGSVGGVAKSHYICSPAHFDPCMMRDFVHPLPLRRLMLKARDTFEPMYASEPLVRKSRDEDRIALDLERRDMYLKALNTARTRLQTPEYFISLFSGLTEDYDPERFHWPSDDGSMDQFIPSRPKPTTAVRSTAGSGESRKRSAASLGDDGTPSGKAQRVSASRNVSAGTLARARRSLRGKRSTKPV
ncbi:hypothetical protein PENSPDRAFT_641476 [Peniophora sp. CONT]|nr:hypothetical protein PENSPDRAFT_641476 [Peniophora sp. CONT]